MERMSLFATKHKRFSLTTLQQIFFRKLSIYLIKDVAVATTQSLSLSLSQTRQPKEIHDKRDFIFADNPPRARMYPYIRICDTARNNDG